MLIEPKDCVITKEYFISLYEKKLRSSGYRTRKQAFYEVVADLDELGYKYPYSSFESFSANRLYK